MLCTLLLLLCSRHLSTFWSHARPGRTTVHLYVRVCVVICQHGQEFLCVVSHTMPRRLGVAHVMVSCIKKNDIEGLVLCQCLPRVALFILQVLAELAAFSLLRLADVKQRLASALRSRGHEAADKMAGSFAAFCKVRSPMLRVGMGSRWHEYVSLTSRQTK